MLTVDIAPRRYSAIGATASTSGSTRAFRWFVGQGPASF
jgi:hypothetical protein